MAGAEALDSEIERLIVEALALEAVRAEMTAKATGPSGSRAIEAAGELARAWVRGTGKILSADGVMV